MPDDISTGNSNVSHRGCRRVSLIIGSKVQVYTDSGTCLMYRGKTISCGTVYSVQCTLYEVQATCVGMYLGTLCMMMGGGSRG